MFSVLSSAPEQRLDALQSFYIIINHTSHIALGHLFNIFSLRQVMIGLPTQTLLVLRKSLTIVNAMCFARSFKLQPRPAQPSIACPSVHSGSDAISQFTNYLDNLIAKEKLKAPKSQFNLIQWQLIITGRIYEMKKQIGPITLNVVFVARAPPPVEEQEDSQEIEEGEDEPEHEEQPQNVCMFTVYVKKSPEAKEYMFADFWTKDQQMKITYAGFTNDYDSHKLTSKPKRLATVYTGPDLSMVDEELIRFLREYLDSLGIDIQLAKFIEKYSVQGEHPKYVKWLQDMREFFK